MGYLVICVIVNSSWPYFLGMFANRHSCIDTDIGMGRGCRVDAFYRSDQGETAEKLLSAYSKGNADEIRHAVESSYVIPHLDHMVSHKKNPKYSLW